MIDLLDQPHKCNFCNRKFHKESSLFSHMCEKKRRALQKNEKRVQAGYMAFNRFWQLAQNNNKPKTYEEFANSNYYNAFVKFGSFLNNVKPIYPDKFIDYVIKSGAKLDKWCRDDLYEKYLFEMLKVEPMESALQRSLQTMIEWADENNADFSHYFRYVNSNKAVQDIVNGRISCWAILNTKSGKELISKMNDEQLTLIAPAFDLQYWLKKFKDQPADAMLAKEICKEAGIE